jgi:putative CocE/NonD family hydrolase
MDRRLSCSIRRTFLPKLAGLLLAPLSLLAAGTTTAAESETGQLSEQNTYREYGYIPLEDGVRLAHIIRRPRKEGRYPTLFIFNEYDADGLSFEGAKPFLEAGYAVLGVNARGSGCSEGDGYSFLDPQGGPDGAAVVEWAAKQPWSDGNIGMFGASNGGMSQIAIAAQQPPHLRAIAPTAIAASLYREEGATAGGMTHLGEAATWTFDLQPKVASLGAEARIRGGDTMCAEIRTRRPAETRFYKDVLAHPLQDRWWESRALENVVDKVRVPTLIQQTWQDPWDMPDGALRLFELLKDDAKRLVVQNGGHGGASSTPRLIRWFDRWVKGEKNGVDDEPKVLINWEHGGAGSDGWTTSYANWPVPELERRTFYLTMDGELTPQVSHLNGKEGARSYVYPMGTELVGSNSHFALAPLSIGSLNYDTTVMKEDLALLGTPILTFHFSSQQRDTDFLFTLKDIDPSGNTLFLQRAYLRASLRAIDPRRTTRDYIAHSFRRHERLVPGKIYEVKLSLGAIGHVVRKGHRLQLSILAPNQIPSPVMGSVPTGGPSINKVFHSARYLSVLDLPVVPGERARAAAPQCGSLPMQPCRAPKPRTQ